jgi:hypothetical protein
MSNRKHREPVLLGMSELDLWHHVALVLMLVSSMIAFLYVSPSKVMQLTIGSITAVMYVGWGIIHHYYDEDLHFKNIIEYVLIALLGYIILAGAIL